MTQKSTMRACEFGIITQAIVNNLTPILFVIFKDGFEVSYTLIAKLMLLCFLIQLFTDAAAVKLINLIGYRKSGILAQSSAAFGLLCLGLLPHFLPTYTALLISVVFYAFGGGLLEVMVSPIVDSLDLGCSPARMNMLHSFYCWGQLAVVFISTSAISIFSYNCWWTLPLFWAIIPIINLFLFTIVPLPKIQTENTVHAVGSLFKSRIFITMCALMLCSGAAEITMSQWASLFAQKGLGVNKFAGDILGPCLFALFMGSGRLFYGIYGNRLPLQKSLIFCSALCILCYGTAALVKNPYIALLCCAATGLSVSIMWPGIFSCSSAVLKNNGTAMFGILALFGDAGCSIGSWLCGTVSDAAAASPIILEYASKYGISPEQIGLKSGIGVTAIFPVIMLLLLVFIRIKHKGRT